MSRSMKAYAVAWVHPNRKLSTRVDANGRNNPTWNDKFVFRVDDEFLANDTSAVMIEIYALHWFRDIHVGTVRVLVGNLIPPPPTRSHQQQHHVQLGMRFVALQVRRPSGRPQGILNIGVALLDSSMRSMPLCTQLSSALGYRHLMGEEDVFHTSNNQSNVSNNQQLSLLLKPELRRTKSDSSSLVGAENVVRKPTAETNPSNPNYKKPKKARSMLGGSEPDPPENENKIMARFGSTASSIFSGSDFIRKANREGAYEFHRSGKYGGVVPRSEETNERQKNGKIGKQLSSINGSDYSDPPRKTDTHSRSPNTKSGSPSITKSPNRKKQNGVDQRTSPSSGYSGYGGQVKFKKYREPIMTESELGPSPSEVAALKAKELMMRRTYDDESSVMIASWDVDSSVEGLQSKLERWRAELPPVYDSSSTRSSTISGMTGGGGGATGGRHTRRHTDGGGGPGLFSCFSNICGCECSIVCGGGGPPAPSPSRKNRRKGMQSQRLRSPSISSSFL